MFAFLLTLRPLLSVGRMVCLFQANAVMNVCRACVMWFCIWLGFGCTWLCYADWSVYGKRACRANLRLELCFANCDCRQCFCFCCCCTRFTAAFPFALRCSVLCHPCFNCRVSHLHCNTECWETTVLNLAVAIASDPLVQSASRCYPLRCRPSISKAPHHW